MKKSVKRLWSIAKKLALGFILGLIFTISAYLITSSIVGNTSSAEFCISCHEMDEAYASWEISAHGSNLSGITVTCVDCHLPPKEHFISHVYAKSIAGAKDFYQHNFGPEYDLEFQRQKVLKHFPQKRCTDCHDNLLAKPANSASRIAHQEVVNNPDKPENQCLRCHENAGHIRMTILYPVPDKMKGE
ncbi:MAG: NapC/NirT family cytochrome c [Phycisphaerae bacterium]|nr:NapC/NirT family cytochrome c [Phycisphaerae bacterium]